MLGKIKIVYITNLCIIMLEPNLTKSHLTFRNVPLDPKSGLYIGYTTSHSWSS